MAYSVYQIKNMMNGKSYIGSTKYNIEARFCQHIYGALTKNKLGTNDELAKDIHRYGINSFIGQALATGIESHDIALAIEAWYIEKLGTHIMAHGYNVGYSQQKAFEGAKYVDVYRVTYPVEFKLSSNCTWDYENDLNKFSGTIDPMAYLNSQRLNGQRPNSLDELYAKGFNRLGGMPSPVSNLSETNTTEKPKQRLYHLVDNSVPYEEYIKQRRCAAA